VTETFVPGAALPRYPGLRFGWPSGGRIRRAWRAFRPEVAYIATEGPLGWSALRTARALGVPAASGFHTRFDDFVAHYGLKLLTPLVFATLRRFHNAADATLVPTRELQAFLERSRFTGVVRLERGVDTALFDPARRDESLRRAWGLAPGELAVLHVGRLAPEKNLELVVRAFEAIRAHHPSARLVWVGDGPSCARLRRERASDVWCGMQRGTELARHGASCDLVLVPSVTETFGNVTIEALASGVPVVAYDYGAAREYVLSGANGRTVPVGDADAFVAAAIDLSYDPAAKRAAARTAVTHLSQRTVAARLAEVLGELATRGRRTA
jgi:glycosyltransferase involved in cell wall biosynthesis